MCAMYYYASKLTAAALSGGGGLIGGGGGGGGGGSGNNTGNGGGVCRCHEAQKEQRSSPRRTTTPQPAQPTHHRSQRTSRVYTPTLGPTTTEHVVIEHPRPNHYHRHRTKHKVSSILISKNKDILQ
ncbi:transformer-2 protein homolog alpha [Monomorium pharaonis]|uniref:transformer-2 protein homolog alpha n=1 Tax=Monomorium pharaonis TaxID=307658 RepID=UPI0017469F43|nr:transformer-2 protein homolog alpha [Monomorium pharaonis]